MFNLKTIVRPNILDLEPYRCARDDFKTGVLLDANENTHGPALDEYSSLEDQLELNRYPDPHQKELKQQIVDLRTSKPNKLFNGKDPITTENLCLGVGSDESIDLLLRCVCTPAKDKLLVCPPTYGMYSLCAKVNDVELVKVPLQYPSFDVDVEAVLSALAEDVKLVYLTSPGNPTAKLISVDLVVELLEKAAQKWNGIIVVDEAYIDFTVSDGPASQSVSTLVNQYPNLVVFQTLSKSFGLAGIRLGVTFANTELSGYLNNMKYPYNISSLTSNVALRATSAEGLKVMDKFVASINEQRLWVWEQLQKIKGIGRNIGGLDANFLLVELVDSEGNPSQEIAFKAYNRLAIDNQVVVRFRGKELNCNGALRISIGTPEENRILIDKFEKVLGELL